MVIRPLVRADMSAAAAVFDRAWAFAFPAFPRRIDVAEFEWETESETVLVAAENGRPVHGFVAMYVPDRFVHHLFVEPRMHGRGTGRALLAAAAQLVEGPLSLKCAACNPRGLAFYRALGWSEVESGHDDMGGWIRFVEREVAIKRS